MTELRLILGDQLNLQHSWFQTVDINVTYLMVEAKSETEYVTHHIQKVVGFFAAMRSFAKTLREQGHKVIYHSIVEYPDLVTISDHIKYEIKSIEPQKVRYLLPDEYRIDQELRAFSQKCSIEVIAEDTEHFFTERNEVEHFFKGKKTYLMESFYRSMRKKYSILMDNDDPVGGKWNFDHTNRKPYKGKESVPAFIDFQHDVSSVVQDIEKAHIATIGTLNKEQFSWPLSRKEALEQVDFFCKNLLPLFGTYEDALYSKEPVLFHSRLSFALNLKMIHPLEVVQKAVKTWENRKDEIGINQIEGFVRQILGWREYMRGLYWARMPEFSIENYFDHANALPKWYWTGETKMNCCKIAVSQSLSMAWAHHIQRLMITGNFALLAGVHPDEVDRWYLGIYIDAIEWVEITNTRGMSQFADGGKIATKPYCSSANYIHKMGDYCSSCYYDKNQKVGDRACPFNSLYWHFYDRHRKRLSNNPRVGMMYRTWDKMGKEKQVALLKQAEKYLSQIDFL